MEHLPATSQRALLEPPTEADLSYEGSFFALAEIHGWSSADWHRCVSCKYHDLEGLDISNGIGFPSFVGFIQSWLFFGLLEAVVGTKIAHKDFVRRNESNDLVLTTAKLNGYLDDWCRRLSRVREANANDSLMDYESFIEKMAILVKTWNIARALDRWTKVNDEHPYARSVSQTAAAVILLQEVLQHTVQDLHTSRQWYGIRPRAPNSEVITSWLRKEMRSANWCESTMNRVGRQFDATVQSYALSVGTVRSNQDHHNCTRVQCSSQRSATGSLKHKTADCTCSLVYVDVTQIVSALRNGWVPAVTIHADHGTPRSVKLKVERAHKDFPWVSISHVWSDGLASPLTNAMTTCQLLHLYDRLHLVTERLHDDFSVDACSDISQVRVWIDALCIPVDAEFQDTRDYAISQMRSLYQDSSAVLALDPDFAGLDSSATPTAILTKVLLSNWSSRLWTYQEGTLCWDVFLAGQDCVHDLRRVLKQAGDSFDAGDSSVNLVVRAMNKELATRTRRFVLFAPTLIDRKPKVYSQLFFASIRDRVTSRPQDEAVVIATFLKLDVTAVLLENGPDMRMRKLMTLLPFIPGNVLFAWGPRLAVDFESDKTSWIPRTFLAPFGVHDLLVDDEVPSDLSSPNEKRPRPQSYIHPAPLYGLAVFAPGISLKFDAPSLTSPFTILIEKRRFKVSGLDQSFNKMGSSPDQAALILSDFEFRAYYDMTAVLVRLVGSAKNSDPQNPQRDFTVAYTHATVAIQEEQRVDGASDEVLDIDGTLLQPAWWLVSPSTTESITSFSPLREAALPANVLNRFA